MVEYSTRQPARRRPVNARCERTRERRIGKRVEVEGPRRCTSRRGGAR